MLFFGGNFSLLDDFRNQDGIRLREKEGGTVQKKPILEEGEGGFPAESEGGRNGANHKAFSPNLRRHLKSGLKG